MTKEATSDSSRSYLQDKVQSLALELAETTQKVSNITSENKQLRADLAQVRNHPRKLILEKIIFRILKSFSKKSWLFSERRRLKFLKSAIKRDPLRSIRSSSDTANTGIVAPFGSRIGHIGKIPQDTSKKNVLVVCHEASLTGAPILGYNIAQKLQMEYNVTVLCLRGGALTDAFSTACVWIEVLEGTISPGSQTWKSTKDLLSENNYYFAVVNSIEARSILPLLEEMKVPSVALLHEFASYTRPETAFPDVQRYATQVVFSSEITLNNALACTNFEMKPNVHVLPQGKSIVPIQLEDERLAALERQRLKALLKASTDDNDLLVIGAGTVQLRKGVDLFIEVARASLEKTGGMGLKFCWIGAGFDPDRDAAYSVYLQDQILRAGIEDHIKILGHTSEIDFVHEISDIFLMTSRLDPLPNVAIDAMAAGNPVLCFDRASGFAPIMQKNGMADDCVADYLDTSEMATKLVQLVKDRTKLQILSDKSKQVADHVFNMDHYVLKIKDLALSAILKYENRRNDADIIAASKSKYFNSNINSGIKAQNIVQHYVSHPNHPDHRPEPGFNPHVYEFYKQNSEHSISNAYASYLHEGRPDGPWKAQIIEGPKLAIPTTLRVALQIHAYYIDELPRIFEHLHANKTRPDLYISIRDEADRISVNNIIKNYPSKVVIREFPNSGRDIGPLITGFGSELVKEYDIIGHVHTKKSLALSDERLVKKWSHFLFENILGGSVGGAMMDAALDEFSCHPKLGVIYPSDPHIIGWTKNRAPAKKMLKCLGLEGFPEYFDFPVGTMFWMRSEVLQNFVALQLDWSDYPKEPIGTDGTVLHAIERLFGIVPQLTGYQSKVTCIEGVSR